MLKLILSIEEDC